MDNKQQKLWFKRKRFGWGWTPCLVEGWIVILIYLIGILKIVLLSEYYAYSPRSVLVHSILPSVILTAILIAVCYMKGEKPKWQWGNTDKE